MREVKYAPQVENMMYMMRDKCVLSKPEDLKLMDELFEVLSAIQGEGIDDVRRVWLSAERGPIEAIGKFEDYQDQEIKTYEDYENMWLLQYPDERNWYQVVAVQYKGSRAVAINNEAAITTDACYENHFPFDVDVKPFMRWLINGCKQVITMLREGTYNDYLEMYLPIKHRTGTILRHDYWQAYPNCKQNDMEDLAEDEINEFLAMMEGVEETPEPTGTIKEMTAQLFFDACALGYKANGMADVGMTAVELYEKYADGRDEGITEISADSSEVFSDWYHNRKSHGGHPWEVVRGGNSTHVDLYVYPVGDAYFFKVAGDHRRGEAIRFYLAIRKAGFPVTINHGRQLADALVGTDKIGIVPEGVFPRYCEGRFPEERIIDFMNLGKEDEEKLAEYIKWQPLPEIRLGEDEKE